MKNKRVVAIIQARLDSKRLPNKVLLKINGKTLLHHLVKRLLNAKTLDAIVVATTTNPEDLAIVEETLKISEELKADNLFWFLGSENDVLGRILKAAEWINVDIIVRTTADNPLTAPEEIDKMIKTLLRYPSVDIIHNKRFDPTKQTVPLGMGCEVMGIWTLRKLDALAKTQRDRENVVFYAFENRGVFKTRVLENKKMHVNARLTIDYPADFKLVNLIIKHIGAESSTEEIIDFLRANPAMTEINSQYADEWGK